VRVLISSGTDPDNTYLLGSSASGNDVFVITRAQLVAADHNGNDDVYDARVGGVQQPTPARVCLRSLRSYSASATGFRKHPPAPASAALET